MLTGVNLTGVKYIRLEVHKLCPPPSASKTESKWIEVDNRMFQHQHGRIGANENAMATTKVSSPPHYIRSVGTFVYTYTSIIYQVSLTYVIVTMRWDPHSTKTVIKFIR